MKTPEYFEQIGQRGFYRPVAVVTFERAVEMVSEVMHFARSLKLTDLLVNTHDLTGFSSPSVFARYALAVKWAESAAGSLRVALVVRPELMDPQKIAVLMAQNRGVSGDAFLTEVEALVWLDGRAAPKG